MKNLFEKIFELFLMFLDLFPKKKRQMTVEKRKIKFMPEQWKEKKVYIEKPIRINYFNRIKGNGLRPKYYSLQIGK